MHISLKYTQVALVSPVKWFIVTDFTSVLMRLGKVMWNTSPFMGYLICILSFYSFFPREKKTVSEDTVFMVYLHYIHILMSKMFNINSTSTKINFPQLSTNCIISTYIFLKLCKFPFVP